MEYLGTGEFRMRINTLYCQTPSSEGQVVVDGKGAWVGLTTEINFLSTSSTEATVKFTYDGLTIMLGDDNIMTWVDSTTEGNYESYRYLHRCVLQAVVTYAEPVTGYQTMAIWTQTPTRALTWETVGNTIVGNEQLLASSMFDTLTPVVLRSDGGVNPIPFLFISDYPHPIITRDGNRFSTNLEYLDGAWVKLSTSSYLTKGITITPTNDEYEHNRIVMPETGYSHVPIQLQRQVENGIPTSDWKLYINVANGYLITNEGFDYAFTEYNNTFPVNESDLLWNIELNENNKTIQLFNKAKMLYLGKTDEDNIILVELKDATDWNMDILFSPTQSTYERYENSDDLKVQCCTDTVDEVNSTPTGIGGDQYNYEVYCPPDYIITQLMVPSSSSYIVPQDAQTCDALIIPWCDDNKTNIVCSCLYPSDLPLLPDNSIITSYQGCFSLNCISSGYIPIDERNTEGKLECPATLCDELYDAEEIDGPIYTDAKSFISCVDPEPEPFDWMLWVYIGAGSLVLIAITIGIIVGVSKVKNKKRREKKVK